MGRAAEIAAALNASLGEGTVRMGSDPSLEVVQWATGCVPFDVILGGGLPAGRSVELFGGWSVLKSYFGLVAIAAVQAQGGTAAIVDTEHAFDPAWAEELGVDLGELIVQHPKTGEDAVKVTTTLIMNQVDLVVWDSVAASQPKSYAEAEPGSSEEQQPARLAVLMSNALRRMTSLNSKTCLLFINQTKTNIGVRFGSKESTPGGRALPYYASMRIRLSRAGKITRDVKTFDGENNVTAKEITGYKIKAELDKSKLNKPHRELWFTFDLDSAEIDETGFLIAQGIEQGWITEPSKGWFTIEEIMDGKVHGRKKLRQWVESDEDVLEWMREKVMLVHLRRQKDEEAEE